MHKLVFVIAATVALLLTGFLQWNAKATPMTAVATAHPKTNASLVEGLVAGYPVIAPLCSTNSVTAVGAASVPIVLAGILGGSTSLLGSTKNSTAGSASIFEATSVGGWDAS